MSILSNNIQYLRGTHKLTQKQLADKLIITRDCLAAYETGRNEPSIQNLIRLSDYFSVTIDHLIKTVI